MGEVGDEGGTAAAALRPVGHAGLEEALARVDSVLPE
jgi:hypothetical protein